MTIRIHTLVETCFACPSQWEAQTEDGREVYIRYRWGRLSWGIATDEEDAVRNSWKNQRSIGDALDGYMTESEMLNHLGDVFTLVEKSSD